jgi:hypothetical protein
MEQDMLWFVGAIDDVHLEALSAKCDEREVAHRFLGYGTTSSFDSSRAADIGRGDTVLWRLKRKGDPYSSLSVNVIDHFAYGEWLHYLEGNCMASGAQVLDGTSAVWANNKLFQLRLADRLGFCVPKHICSNDKVALLDFMAAMRPRQLIKKPFRATSLPNLSQPLVQDNPRLWYGVSRITEDQVALASPDDVQRCPVFLQEEIRKSHELRVILVGDEVFCVKIDSQSRPEAALDFRLGHHRDMYSRCELDPEIAARLRLFREEAGLFSGVFDLIVGQDGLTYFLECNPHGQWIFHDHIAPGEVADLFVRGLERRMTEHAHRSHPGRTAAAGDRRVGAMTA